MLVQPPCKVDILVLLMLQDHFPVRSEHFCTPHRGLPPRVCLWIARDGSDVPLSRNDSGRVICKLTLLATKAVYFGKGKRRFVYCLVAISTSKALSVDHTVLPANTPHLPLPRSSPEGATTEWIVVAPADEAYYSLIDPVRMKGWVGLVGLPTADGLPI